MELLEYPAFRRFADLGQDLVSPSFVVARQAVSSGKDAGGDQDQSGVVDDQSPVSEPSARRGLDCLKVVVGGIAVET
jgi:hypothetical protein